MHVHYEVHAPAGKGLAFRVGKYGTYDEALKVAQAEEGAAYVTKVTREVLYSKPGKEADLVIRMARKVLD